MELVPDRSIQISIDRGGTFTDIYASWPTTNNNKTTTRSEKLEIEHHRHELVIKLLSLDSAYQDAPIEGIRRVLESILHQSIPRNQKLNTQKIDYIRLSTTVATNALLERRGARHALLITKGFQDLLEIGNQSRPRIFDLAIHKPSTLYSKVIQIDERVTLVPDHHHHHHHQNTSTSEEHLPTHSDRLIKGNSGEWVQIIKPLDQLAVRLELEKLKSQGFESLAVVLMHSYTFPEHELEIGRIANQLGFKHVSLSSRLMPMIKLVPRGTSSTADAYLTPILRDYLDGFYKGFDESFTPNHDPHSSSPSTRVEFMRSDGGLTDLENFSGLNSILSGPAGGVVGYALTTYDPNNRIPIIGLDMGGTSTDVSRFDGRYETVFETTTAGITVQSPQLDINTVAAGGGSRLFWRNGLFVTGPESAGASPGPACYRKGGPLAVTDANLILGRLIPRHFPKIFGPNEDQELDLEITRSMFHDLRRQINSDLHQELSLDQVAWGFIKIANETMCRPIRALTEARGYDTSKHILSVFGGAGGQHACAIARTLNIKRIIIHKHSSVLSAYGLALADRVIESQQPSAMVYEPEGENRSKLEACLDRLEIEVRAQLNQQGFRDDRIRVERYLNLRYEGTDTALMILGGSNLTNRSQVVDVDQQKTNDTGAEKGRRGLFDYFGAFEESYQQEFGFLLDSKNLICDDIRVRAIGKSFDKLDDTITQQLESLEFKSIPNEARNDEADDHQQAPAYESVYFEGHGRIRTQIFRLDGFKTGDLLVGPALLLDQTQTIIIDPHVQVRFLRSHLVIDLN